MAENVDNAQVTLELSMQYAVWMVPGRHTNGSSDAGS